jgi:hypothetical protein
LGSGTFFLPAVSRAQKIVAYAHLPFVSTRKVHDWPWAAGARFSGVSSQQMNEEGFDFSAFVAAQLTILVK